MILLILFAAVLAVAVAAWLRHMIGRHGLGALFWRWHSGHALDGQHRTNATWTKRSHGTRAVLHPTGHAVWWHHQPRLHRAGIRVGTELLGAVVLYGLLVDRLVTLLMLAIAATAGLALAAWYGVYTVRGWQHQRHYVKPLEGTLLHGIPAPPTRLEVKRSGDVIQGVVIEWPPDTEIGPAEQQHAMYAVTARLAIEAPEVKWQTKGRNRLASFTQSEPPPSRVSWEDVEDAVKSAAANELVFGLGKKGAIVKASYSESPHIAIPGGSGGGKSNLAAFMLLQELRRGSLIFNLDPKWISHLWLQGLPNVISAHDTADLHLALAWLGKELLRRTKAAYYSAGGTGRVRGNVGPRLIVLCEELNYGMQGLKDLYAEIRDKDVDPKRSPALTGLSAMSAAGRASDMHEWLIAQLLTAAATGVPDSSVRANCGIKLMARWERPGWDMVVGKHIPMPPQTTIPGRIQVVTGEGVRETQVPYLHLDDKDTEVSDKAVSWARQLAVSGTVARIPSGPEGVPFELWPPGVAAQVGSPQTPPDQLDVVRHDAPEPPTLTLRDAVGQGVFGSRSLAAVRKAIERADDPPQPVGTSGAANLYLLSDLHALAKGIR